MSKIKNDSNFELRKKLKALVSQAKTNELKLQKLQHLELLFISSESLPELIDIVLQTYRAEYELDYISILLIDPDYEIRHVIEFMSPSLLKMPTLIFTNTHTDLENVIIAQGHADAVSSLGQAQNNLFPNFRNDPYLGECSPECKNVLFPAIDNEAESVAIVPLIRNHKLIGSLNLASYDPARFVKGTATDLIKRLSAILAVCIENAVNHEKLKLLGLTDALTGIHNRRYFMQRLDEEIARGLRQHIPTSCLFIDIDHFKAFNDLYGHSVGDEVLRFVAGVIKNQMRISDVLARYGGEEFAVLLTNTDSHLALEIAERIRTAICTAVLPVTALTEELHVTVSVGCTTLLDTDMSNITELGATLLNAADHALYASKGAGRNCTNVSDFNEIVKTQSIH
ncbi:MAG: DUF484 family protein [Woeseiaceae bacterium]